MLKYNEIDCVKFVEALCPYMTYIEVVVLGVLSTSVCSNFVMHASHHTPILPYFDYKLSNDLPNTKGHMSINDCTLKIHGQGSSNNGCVKKVEDRLLLLLTIMNVAHNEVVL